MGAIDRLYAAYRSGCLNEDRLSSYYPFFASIIYEHKWEVVDEERVRSEFEKKYTIPLPATFVRQVLGTGIENGSIVIKQGEYFVDRNKMKEHCIQTNEFDKKWKKLVDEFRYYCKKNDFSLECIDVEKEILNIIERNDTEIVLGNGIVNKEGVSRISYIWGSYVDALASSNTQQFEFLAAISLSNIIMQAIFLCEDYKTDFAGLTLLLDSPIIFALLGMDSKERVESCRMLVDEAIRLGCSVQILDNNLQEVKGIITRASMWALSKEYDIAKANKVSAYLHDSDLDENDILEMPLKIEEILNRDFHVTVKTTDYDVFNHAFQEDESALHELIEAEYRLRDQKLLEEKLQSIKVDIRSIVMIYRERRGQIAVTINECRYLMLTLNSAIAIASKKYESNQSIESGHVPACITADLFGAILWLSRPATLMEYKKHQMLADCYSAMQPTPQMLKKYIETLNLARDAGDIDEKRFIFLRSNPVARDALMKVTKGDYSKFSQRTYQEVYEEIKATSEKKFADEQQRHEETKKLNAQLQNDNKRRDHEIETLKATVISNNQLILQMRKSIIDTKSKIFAMVLNILITGAPIIVAVGLIEVFKATLINVSLSTYIISGLATVAEIPIIATFKKTYNRIKSRLVYKYCERDEIYQNYKKNEQ